MQSTRSNVTEKSTGKMVQILQQIIRKREKEILKDISITFHDSLNLESTNLNNIMTFVRQLEI